MDGINVSDGLVHGETDVVEEQDLTRPVLEHHLSIDSEFEVLHRRDTDGGQVEGVGACRPAALLPDGLQTAHGDDTLGAVDGNIEPVRVQSRVTWNVQLEATCGVVDLWACSREPLPGDSPLLRPAGLVGRHGLHRILPLRPGLRLGEELLETHFRNVLVCLHYSHRGSRMTVDTIMAMTAGHGRPKPRYMDPMWNMWMYKTTLFH